MPELIDRAPNTTTGTQETNVNDEKQEQPRNPDTSFGDLVDRQWKEKREKETDPGELLRRIAIEGRFGAMEAGVKLHRVKVAEECAALLEGIAGAEDITRYYTSAETCTAIDGAVNRVIQAVIAEHELAVVKHHDLDAKNRYLDELKKPPAPKETKPLGPPCSCGAPGCPNRPVRFDVGYRDPPDPNP